MFERSEISNITKFNSGLAFIQGQGTQYSMANQKNLPHLSDRTSIFVLSQKKLQSTSFFNSTHR